MLLEATKRQSVISLFSILFLTALGFLSTMYFAHVLGPEALGGYFLFLAYYGIFDLILDGGLGSAVVKRISEGKEQNEYFSAFMVMRIVLFGIALLILIALEPYLIDLTSAGLFIPLLLALLVSVFTGGVLNGIYGRGKIGVIRFGEILNFFVKVIVQVSAVVVGYGLAGLYGGVIAGMIAAGIFYGKFFDLHLAYFDKDHLRSLFTFSFWMFLTASGAILFNYADVLMIGYFLGNSDVGIYRTAFQLTSAATFVTIALHGVLYPKISQWSVEQEYTRIERALSRAFTYSLALAVPVCVGGLVMGDKMLYFFYGAQFEEGTQAFFILLLVQVVNVFMYLQTMFLNALDRPIASFKSTAVAVTINLILNAILIPLIGYTGAAWATLAAMVLNAVFAFYMLSKMLHVAIERRPVGLVLFSAFMMGFLLLILRFLFPISGIAILLLYLLIGMGIYLILLLKFEQTMKEEIEELISQAGGFSIVLGGS